MTHHVSPITTKGRTLAGAFEHEALDGNGADKDA